MNTIFRKALDWLLFRDIIGNGNNTSGEVNLETDNAESQESMISQQVSRKKIVSINDPSALEKRETVIETENGIASIRNETLVLCSCGRLVPEPYAICTICKMPICSPEHFIACGVCQSGLCPRCVRWFKTAGEHGKEQSVPLCEQHYSVSRLSGKLSREWS